MIGELLTMTSKLPMWPFYPGDYLRDTQHLTAAESGAYLHLLMTYWANGSLPTDDEQLRKIARMTGRQWKDARPTLAQFFDASWHHKRIERDLANAQRTSEIRSAAARKRYPQAVDNEHGGNRSRASDVTKIEHHSGAKPLKSHKAPSANARNHIRKKKDTLSYAARETRGAYAARPNSLSTNRKRQQARQRWEAGLVHALGPNAFAQALDLFAADPQLADQITDAELRKTGNGVPAALDAIRKRIGGKP